MYYTHLLSIVIVPIYFTFEGKITINRYALALKNMFGDISASHSGRFNPIVEKCSLTLKASYYDIGLDPVSTYSTSLFRYRTYSIGNAAILNLIYHFFLSVTVNI
jgi:hypothetical protein